MNQTLENLHSCFMGKNVKQWELILSQVEFAYMISQSVYRLQPFRDSSWAEFYHALQAGSTLATLLCVSQPLWGLITQFRFLLGIIFGLLYKYIALGYCKSVQILYYRLYSQVVHFSPLSPPKPLTSPFPCHKQPPTTLHSSSFILGYSLVKSFYILFFFLSFM